MFTIQRVHFVVRGNKKKTSTKPHKNLAKEISHEDWSERTTSYLDHSSHTASISEAGGYPLGIQRP